MHLRGGLRATWPSRLAWQAAPFLNTRVAVYAECPILARRWTSSQCLAGVALTAPGTDPGQSERRSGSARLGRAGRPPNAAFA